MNRLALSQPMLADSIFFKTQQQQHQQQQQQSETSIEDSPLESFLTSPTLEELDFDFSTDSCHSPVSPVPLSPILSDPYFLSNPDDLDSWTKVVAAAGASPEQGPKLKLEQLPLDGSRMSDGVDPMMQFGCADDVAFGFEGLNHEGPLFPPPPPPSSSSPTRGSAAVVKMEEEQEEEQQQQQQQQQQRLEVMSGIFSPNLERTVDPMDTTASIRQPSRKRKTTSSASASASASVSTSSRRANPTTHNSLRSTSSSPSSSSPSSPPPAPSRRPPVPTTSTTSSSARHRMRRETSSASASGVAATPTTGGRRPQKTSHNMVEKRYRNNLNDKIAALRDSVPSLRVMVRRLEGESGAANSDVDDDAGDNLCFKQQQQQEEGDEAADDLLLGGLEPAHKLNKATILSKATEYIAHLEKRNRALSRENEGLKRKVEGFEMFVLNGGMRAGSSAAGSATGSGYGFGNEFGSAGWGPC